MLLFFITNLSESIKLSPTKQFFIKLAFFFQRIFLLNVTLRACGNSCLHRRRHHRLSSTSSGSESPTLPAHCMSRCRSSRWSKGTPWSAWPQAFHLVLDGSYGYHQSYNDAHRASVACSLCLRTYVISDSSLSREGRESPAFLARTCCERHRNEAPKSTLWFGPVDIRRVGPGIVLVADSFPGCCYLAAR